MFEVTVSGWLFSGDDFLAPVQCLFIIPSFLGNSQLWAPCLEADSPKINSDHTGYFNRLSPHERAGTAAIYEADSTRSG